MSKFNKPRVRAAVSSPIKAEAAPSGRTHQGAPGYARDTKGELFLLAVSYMGSDTFYEKDETRSQRFRDLVVAAGHEDPDWTTRFLKWLRAEGNMRSAPLEAAVELVHAKPEGMRTRAVVESVLQRADEPGEILACWLARYGKPIPIALKRGVADAVTRLYNQTALLKYDSDQRGVRFGDVVDLVQPAYHRPEIRGTWQYELFGHALDRRHKRDKPIPERLGLLRARAELMALPVEERRAVLDTPQRLSAAGMTWEALAGWLQGPMDAKAWEAILPTMGLFATVRNLRNFDQAGVSDEAAEKVCTRLADPEQVRRSRMFPFRFWAAYKHTSSLRWAHALEKAITASLDNVPSLGGRTLILVDRSPSMFPGQYFSTPNTSDIPLAEQAAVFGSAVALRTENATLVEYGGTSREIPVAKGGSVLRLIEQFTQISYTDTFGAVRENFKGHDRILIVTDEQNFRAEQVNDVPDSVPVYVWNVAGYKHGQGPSGSGQRHTFGGLTDAAFGMIPLLEAGRSADWPF